jgi:hypothetical protein
MNYYISRGGQQYGPYSLDDLTNMSAQGRVDANDLAWGEGMASWTPVSQVLGSTPAAAVTPQQYTPPPQQQQPQQVVPQLQPQAQPQQYDPQPQYAPQQQYTPQPQYGQPQQQYAQPQQQYGQSPAYGAAAAPAYGAPVYNAGQAGYAPQPMAGGPMPPNMHWALVLVLSMVTGIFGIIWTFMEMSFVKKIDPASKAMKLYIFAIITLPIGLIVGFGLIVAGATGGSSTAAGGAAALGSLILFAAYICTFVFMIMAMFNMRRSIETYYNTVEPIGLKLSPVMTFFFNMLYFQYHFSRIATWKQTGRLE